MDTGLLTYADVNGARLRFIDRGTGPALFLVHGLGATHADWEKQIDSLARVFRVIAPDLRGHGSSEGEGPFSIERFATDLLQLAEQLKIARFAAVGHSMGGAVAMQMALFKPERVQKLVLADTLPDFRTDTLKKRLMYWMRVLTLRFQGPRALATRTANRMFPKPEQAALREAAIRRGSQVRPLVYIESLKALSGWNIADRLDWLAMPILVIAGDHDYFPPDVAQKFAERLPNGVCRILEGAHHHLPLERPDDFNRFVQDFLLPGSHAAPVAAKADNALNWLRVDPNAVKAIDVEALLRIPPKK